MTDSAAPSNPNAPPPEIHFAQQALMDADRVMLQFVQTSLSMIGMGASIYSFFTNVIGSAGVEDRIARQLGLSLLVLGLALLATGTVSQARYRFRLMKHEKGLRAKYPKFALYTYYTAHTFVVAIALLLVGTVALVLLLVS